MSAGRRSVAHPTLNRRPSAGQGSGPASFPAELVRAGGARERQPTEAHGDYQLEPISRRDAGY
jgi:hypothetical protein